MTCFYFYYIKKISEYLVSTGVLRNETGIIINKFMSEILEAMKIAKLYEVLEEELMEKGIAEGKLRNCSRKC
ncbi:hypothetical protein [Niallia sp. Krafla_26]|uniref:hypothetical protein n=1 Tax=Niallia sp. Krafla_26 TaxID=3064703 RepID=UPI003D1813F3